MFVVDPVVYSESEGLAGVGRRGNTTQAGYRRKIGLYDVNTVLICVLKVAEEESLVFLDRAANPESGLSASKERVVGEAVTLQARVRAHVVVAEIEIPGAVIIVAARPRDYVY